MFCLTRLSIRRAVIIIFIVFLALIPCQRVHAAQPSAYCLQFNIEPGYGFLDTRSKDNSNRGWHFSYSLAWALSHQLLLRGFVTYNPLQNAKNHIQTYSGGATVMYYIDRYWIAPYAEVGGAIIRLVLPDLDYHYQEWTPTLGVGTDFFIEPSLIMGVGLRYFALFESKLTRSPAYTTLWLKLGFNIDFF